MKAKTMTFRNKILVWLTVVGACVMLVFPVAKAQQVAAIPCNSKAIYDASTSGSTRLIAAPTNGRAILICGFTFFTPGITNVGLNYGTGTDCGTGAVALTPAFQFTAQSGIAEPATAFRGMSAPAGNDVCINSSAGVAVQAIVYYVVR